MHPRKIYDCVGHVLEGAAGEEFMAGAREIHCAVSDCQKASHGFLSSPGVSPPHDLTAVLGSQRCSLGWNRQDQASSTHNLSDNNLGLHRMASRSQGLVNLFRRKRKI